MIVGALPFRTGHAIKTTVGASHGGVVGVLRNSSDLGNLCGWFVRAQGGLQYENGP